MLIQQGVYGAVQNTQTKRTNPRVKGHGFSIVKGIKESDASLLPLKLMAGIEWLIEEQMIQDVDPSMLTIFMPWIEFNCLRDADRIVDARYNTASGTTVTGFVLKSFNIPIVPTNHFPKKSRDHTDIDGADNDHHILSNASNGYRYDVATGTNGEDQEKCAALVLGREGLLVGRSIDLQGKIWFNDANKSWYIDSWISEGAIPDRWEHLSVLMKTTADTTGLQARYERKITPVNHITVS